ncbi:MAG: acetylglutamate kinase [Alphaproteobacteria bacterium TMED87]|nr:acetylglutamate kinase [Rhodospirillaceae bacterium]OUV10496.1 MAG: acetylglutamate kinase [Alphaproteobacteria bacterium TMED87]
MYSSKENEGWLKKAGVLADALPYMKKFSGKTVVIKFGGHAMGENELSSNFARDVVLLKQVGINPVIVHGGGPQIGRMLDRLKITSTFIDGLRVTNSSTVEIVEMVLSGSINKQIVSDINTAGGCAVGLSGKDGNMILARKLQRLKKDPDSNIEKVLDLGFVGEPQLINAEILKLLNESKIIPVIAPIGIGEAGETFNINADTVAGSIASALNASRLLMLTDVDGVMDEEGKLINEMKASQVKKLVKTGVIKGGMIPKVETCLRSVEEGVDGAVIIDGRVSHSILLELFTSKGAGTIIRT